MIPFQGLFGDTSELRLMHYLLPLGDLEYNISELQAETDISRPVLTKVVRKFSEWEILDVIRHGKRNFYAINDNSPFVKLFQDMNCKIIEHMLSESVVQDLREHRRLQDARITSIASLNMPLAFVPSFNQGRLALTPRSAFECSPVAEASLFPTQLPYLEVPTQPQPWPSQQQPSGADAFSTGYRQGKEQKYAGIRYSQEQAECPISSGA